MTTKKITCIDCPQGCQLEVSIEKGYVVKVTGQKCPKGEKYAHQETENPQRTLTSTILTDGLKLKMVPVRTSLPIPKSQVLTAMAEIMKVRLNQPVKVGAVIIKDLLGLGADLIATRDAD
jgi:CxxC motif-containing protein